MLPAKVVAVWCSAEEQNKACGIALWGGEIGMLIGTVTPILFVQNKHSNEDIKGGLFHLLISNAVVCGAAFFAVVLFFKAKPPSPPSIQQCALINNKLEYKQAFEQLLRNKDFVWNIIIFGTSCGIWGVFGIIENMLYLNYFPDSLSDLAVIAPITTFLGGMIGNVAFGILLDRTLKYKLVTFLSLLCSTLTYGALAVSFEMKWHAASYAFMIVFGFFCSSSVNISFQYIAEVTYPVSEVITISILQAAISFVTIVYELLFNVLLEAQWHITVHVIVFITFCVLTGCTYFCQPI
ncbi:hypothetical protein HHI36_008525 [Cryptolaemus montrouzieri]|uniref:Major facilitator superfamily (MFS) profile domain-containing protein n=1 Tax=Cryptolaemus montrouzieri TaxID=559131 RepID=A0ABD2MSR0_9CUCU